MKTVLQRLRSPGSGFSLEFFPPKTDAEEVALGQTVRVFEDYEPSFVSVTYGAGGSSADRTVRIASDIATNTTMLPVGHLTAVGHSVTDLHEVIDAFSTGGVRNILALRGDPPGDPNGAWIPHPDGLRYAADLVAMIKDRGDFCVGVAAFPDKHPRSASLAADTEHFVAKVRAGADYAISQMLFSAEDYVRLRDRLAAADCHIPIVPGIMPVTSMSRLRRICQLSGQKYPHELATRLAEAGPDARAVGVEHAVSMCAQLAAEGAPGLHFYTFNRSAMVLEVLGTLGYLGAERKGADAVGGRR